MTFLQINISPSDHDAWVKVPAGFVGVVGFSDNQGIMYYLYAPNNAYPEWLGSVFKMYVVYSGPGSNTINDFWKWMYTRFKDTVLEEWTLSNMLSNHGLL